MTETLVQSPLATKIRTAVSGFIGHDAEHRSRVHTRGGQIPPLREWRRLPRLAAARLGALGAQPPQPWMAPGAVEALDALISSEMRILELGSGTSTQWYARRAAQVVSLEPNQQWARRVQDMLSLQTNAEIRETSIRVGLPEALAGAAFDLLVIDHSDEPGLSRPDAVHAALLADTPPRIIVLDDSDRIAYRAAFTMLRDWEARVYRGFRPSPFHATETTVFVDSAAPGAR